MGDKDNSIISGEVTAEIFETWFPDKPELVLMDWLKTDGDRFSIFMEIENMILVSVISREWAEKLLKELKLMKGIK